jgi:ABC-2 type transport system permease protein
MLAHPNVHLTILRTAVEERLVYRADFALGTLLRFLPIITTIFLWQAIFAGSDKDEIATFRYGDMVAYYLLAMVARAFSSMPGLASGIAREVRDGSIKRFLVQPIDLVGFLFWSRVAHKLVYYAIATGPFVLVFFLCRGFFPGWPDGWMIAGFALSLILGFVLGFLFEVLIGLIAFWFLEVSSLLFIWMLLNYFLSGHMFPLDVVPGTFGQLLKLLPFQYFAYWPAVIMLGKVPHAELAEGLMIEVGWVIALLGLTRLAYWRGLRRYSAFGG